MLTWKSRKSAEPLNAILKQWLSLLNCLAPFFSQTIKSWSCPETLLKKVMKTLTKMISGLFLKSFFGLSLYAKIKVHI